MDDITEVIFLWAFPKKFEPNWLSYFRVATVPVIAYLLLNNYLKIGFTLFVISALTDLIDGAMARKRNKITDIGKVLDPIADKLLIGTMLIYVGFDYTIVKIFLGVIVIEILANLMSSILAYKIGRPIGANIYGKIKMTLQCLCVGLFTLGVIIKNSNLVEFSTIVLEVALFFAILAGIEGTHQKWPAIKKHLGELVNNI